MYSTQASIVITLTNYEIVDYEIEDEIVGMMASHDTHHVFTCFRTCSGTADYDEGEDYDDEYEEGDEGELIEDEEGDEDTDALLGVAAQQAGVAGNAGAGGGAAANQVCMGRAQAQVWQPHNCGRIDEYAGKMCVQSCPACCLRNIRHASRQFLSCLSGCESAWLRLSCDCLFFLDI